MDLAVSELHWTNSLLLSYNTIVIILLLFIIFYPTFNLYMYTPSLPPPPKTHALGYGNQETHPGDKTGAGCLWLSKTV